MLVAKKLQEPKNPTFLMQTPQRNTAKLARRRVLVVITARTRRRGVRAGHCYAVSYASCLLGAGIQITDPFFCWSPFGGCCPARGSVPSGGAAAVAAEDPTPSVFSPSEVCRPGGGARGLAMAALPKQTFTLACRLSLTRGRSPSGGGASSW